jgi:general secretion pathway protein E
MALGDILVRKGYLPRAQLEAVLQRLADEVPRRDLRALLSAEKLVSPAVLAEALAEEYGLEWTAAVEPDWLSPDLVDRLSVDWARAHVMLPVRRQGRLAVLTEDPAAVTGLDDLALLLGQEVTPIVAPREVILQAIEGCYFQRTGSSAALLHQLTPTAAEAAPARAADDLLRASDAAPVTQLVNMMLLEAVKKRASDVHVEPFEDRLQVRYRIDGFLYEQAPPPKHLESALVSRLKVMARLDIAERRLPQDGMAKVRVGEREIDIRVSTVPVAEGERVVLRLLNREHLLLPLTSLGMPDDVRASFEGLLREPNGIILVTGPTGSGKTTTLYSALRCLDTAHANVLTIEDPIEYQLPGIGQIQVKPKIGLTFANGLRHILRQDPDVIFVGEIRDLETAEIAIRASLTGHLVFSTLHTNDAISAVVRLLDMGIESYLLGAAVRAVLAQRLVRQLCPSCRQPASATPSELQALGPAAARLRDRTVWRPGAGCPACLGGYRDRTGLYEFLVLNAGLQDAVRRREDAVALRNLAGGQGLRTLLDDGISKVLSGVTSVEELLRVIGSSARG